MLETKKDVRGCELIHDPKNGLLLAIVIRRNLKGDKYNFVTPESFPLQLGINFYKAGENIQPHRHSPWMRHMEQTQEFVMVSEGEAVLHLYGDNQAHVCDVLLDQGDSVLLASGGHGFTIKKDTRITEVKLGPYDAGKDKIRFNP